MMFLKMCQTYLSTIPKRLATAITVAPSLAKSKDIALPTPELAPV